LRAYLDESVEDDVVEEVMEQVSHEKTVTEPAQTAQTASASLSVIPEYVPAAPVAKPATTPSYFGSKPDDSDRIKIFTEAMELSNLDVHVIAPPPVELKDSNLLNEIEVLA